jgi:hypothetical protein
MEAEALGRMVRRLLHQVQPLEAQAFHVVFLLRKFRHFMATVFQDTTAAVVVLEVLAMELLRAEVADLVAEVHTFMLDLWLLVAAL